MATAVTGASLWTPQPSAGRRGAGGVAVAMRRLVHLGPPVVPVGYSLAVTLTGDLVMLWATYRDRYPVWGQISIPAASAGAHLAEVVQAELHGAIAQAHAGSREGHAVPLWQPELDLRGWPLQGTRPWPGAGYGKTPVATGWYAADRQSRRRLMLRERAFTAGVLMTRQWPARYRAQAPVAFVLPAAIVQPLLTTEERAGTWTVAVDGSVREGREPSQASVGGWAAVTCTGLVAYGPAPARPADAELVAAIRALRLFPDGARVLLLSDKPAVRKVVVQAYRSTELAQQAAERSFTSASTELLPELFEHLGRLGSVRISTVAGSKSPMGPAGPIYRRHRLHQVADVLATGYTYAIRYPHLTSGVLRALLRAAAERRNRDWIKTQHDVLPPLATDAPTGAAQTIRR